MRPIVIVAPPYVGHSNGIKTLHKICHTINQLGGCARLMFWYAGVVTFGGVEWTNAGWDTPCLTEDDKEIYKKAIVVYPEIVKGNPMDAPKVARYLGNKEGLLNGMGMDIGSGDFLVAHSKVIRPDADYVLFNAEINPVFNDDGSEHALNRNMDVTYIGKGAMYGGCTVQPRSLLVERVYPRGQEQLAYVLKRTRFFYTWDSWSAINVEAIMCGAVPVFMRYEPWTENEIDGSELGILPRNVIQGFDDGRDRLIGRIKELDETWDSRVGEFCRRIDLHFA